MRTEKDLMNLKKDELIETAKSLNIDTSGTKAELTTRILASEVQPAGEAGQDFDEITESKIDIESSDATMSGEEGIIEDESENSGEASVESSAESSQDIIFDELPSRWLIAGGLRPVPYLSTLAVVFILMFTYGFNDFYSVQYAVEGSDKEYIDCARITYHSLGDGNTTDYDPTNQANIDCAELLGISPNWWQEDMDAWLQSMLDSVSGNGNETGFIWTQVGIDTMAYLGASTFNANMSVYGDPIAGDEFTEQDLAIWNGYTATMGGGNDTIEDLLVGGGSPFAIYMPMGIVDYKPTGFLWTQAGIDTMAYLGASTFNTNMSVFGDPSNGDVFTAQHLAVWNGFAAAFPGGGTDTYEDLLPSGGSPFAIYMPQGIVEHAPTGYFWSHPGVPTMAYLGSSTFGANMSVFANPAPGDVFTAQHLAVWNGFTLQMGGGNDTIADLLPGGASPFAIYMPSGIVITEAEWTNQTPSVSNVTVEVNGTTNTTMFSCGYIFSDAQGDSDNSTIIWFINNSYAANTSTYSANLTNGTTIACMVTPYDGLYWGVSIESQDHLILATED